MQIVVISIFPYFSTSYAGLAMCWARGDSFNKNGWHRSNDNAMSPIGVFLGLPSLSVYSSSIFSFPLLASKAALVCLLDSCGFKLKTDHLILGAGDKDKIALRGLISGKDRNFVDPPDHPSWRHIYNPTQCSKRTRSEYPGSRKVSYATDLKRTVARK
jgi:hypothetical protein